MALNLGTLFFRVDANTRGLKKAGLATDKFTKNAERSFQRTSGAASKLGIAIAGIVSIEAGRRLIMFADSYNVLVQRIKTATKATGDFNQVSAELFAIANRTGTELRGNVALFQSLARAAPELGATNAQILKLTEAVGQLGAIGGSSAEQMKNGLMQFSQAMAGGVLRAEELNSILENTPEIANRIARGLGKTVGQLRAAVIDGGVLADDVFQSLIGQVDEIGNEFKGLGGTVGRSFTSMMNSLQQLVGGVDQATGATEAFASAFESMSKFLAGVDMKNFGDQLQRAGAYIKVMAVAFGALWIHAKVMAALAAGTLSFAAALSVARVAAIRLGVFLPIVLLGELVYQIESTEHAFAKFADFLIRAIAGMVQAISDLTRGFKLWGFSFDDLTMKLDDVASAMRDMATFEAEATARLLANTASRIAAVGMEASALKNLAALRRGEEPGPTAAPAAAPDVAPAAFMGKFAQLQESLMSELELEKKHYARSLALVQEAENYKLVTMAEAKNLELELTRNHNAKLAEMDAARVEESRRFQGEAIASAKTAAGQDLAIARDRVVGLGSLWESSLAVAARHNKKAFEAQKSLALVSTVISGAQGIAAGFKAGPIVGAVLAAITAAAIGIQYNAIKSQQFQGGKETGGDVFAGGTYRVNERGPELLSVGSKNYLMMGNQKGSVTPNNKMGGGGQQVAVNVYPQPGETAQVTNQVQADGSLDISVVIDQMESRLASNIANGGGSLGNAMESQYGLNRARGASR